MTQYNFPVPHLCAVRFVVVENGIPVRAVYSYGAGARVTQYSLPPGADPTLFMPRLRANGVVMQGRPTRSYVVFDDEPDRPGYHGWIDNEYLRPEELEQENTAK